MKIYEPIEAQYLYELAKERNKRIEILDTTDVDEVVATATEHPELKTNLFTAMQIKLKTEIAKPKEDWNDIFDRFEATKYPASDLNLWLMNKYNPPTRKEQG